MADPKKRFDIIIKKLKEKGHKITPQRIVIISIISKSYDHPSVEDIYTQVKKDFPTMSLATVYRNIVLIKSIGEILELGFPDGSNRYDGNKPYPHPHVICTKCKKVLDPELQSFDSLKKEIIEETGFQITSHRLDFFGVCMDCRKKDSG